MENSTVFSFSSTNLDKSESLQADLIVKAKAGEEGAFGQIYNFYFKRIYKFIFFRVGHKEVAEDLSEDVFIKAYSKISSVSEVKSFEAWLYQIARNTVIDYYREKKMLVDLEEVENILEYESNLLDLANLSQQQQVVLKFIKELAPDQQLVIKMKFFENLENDAIAQSLGKTEGAIRVIQHRAIAKLQEMANDIKEKNRLD